LIFFFMGRSLLFELHLSSASIIGSLTAIHDQETDLLIPSLWFRF
jgi:hypothetical protein